MIDAIKKNDSPRRGSRRRLGLACPIAALLLSAGAAGAGEPANDRAGPGGADQVLVRVRPGAEFRGSATAGWTIAPADKRKMTMAVAATSLAATEILRDAGVRRAAPLVRSFGDGGLAASLGLDRVYRLEVVAGAGPARLVGRLNALGLLVELAELDGVGGPATLPNDPFFDLQYGVHNVGQTIAGIVGVADADIDGPDAWSLGTSTAGVAVALLDSGLDPHVELAGRILPGINVPDGTTITVDECASHGTHVSGILAATRDNGIGIAGVADEVTLTPWVVVDGCTGFESWVATALVNAADLGYRLINMSLQYSTGTTVLRDAVLYAHAKGAIMVAASGNSGSSLVAFPGRWPETICVAALRPDDQVWASSNFGPSVEFAAAGVSVYSLVGTSGYGYKSGTSMAVPLVTGTISLMLGKNPDLTLEEIRAILVASATDVGAPGRDDFTGFGRVNAYAALLATPGRTGDIDGDGSVGPADLAILLGSWGACPDCESGCPADLDGDCTVGAADLAMLLGAWG